MVRNSKALVGVDKSEGRYQVIVSQCNWLKKFISDKNFKIKDISSSLFMNYYTFRRKQTNDEFKMSLSSMRRQQSMQSSSMQSRMDI